MTPHITLDLLVHYKCTALSMFLTSSLTALQLNRSTAKLD